MTEDQSPAEPAIEVDETSQTVGKTVADMKAAYADVMKAAGTQISSEAFKEITEGFASIATNAGIFAGMNFSTPIVPPHLRDVESFEIPDYAIDRSPMRTASNTKRMADQMEDMHDVLSRMMTLTAANVELAKEQHKSAERSQRFSRRTTIATIVISGASLVAAVVAVATSL